MKGHFIFCTPGHRRELKYGCRPLSQLVMHTLTADRYWLSPLLDLSFSHLLSTSCCLFSLCSPSWFSLWFIITDWLLVSLEGGGVGGHTVQLTSQAPGTQAFPLSSPLLRRWRDTREPALQWKRWASSCVLIPYSLPHWCLESLSGWKSIRRRLGFARFWIDGSQQLMVWRISAWKNTSVSRNTLYEWVWHEELV